MPHTTRESESERARERERERETYTSTIRVARDLKVVTGERRIGGVAAAIAVVEEVGRVVRQGLLAEEQARAVVGVVSLGALAAAVGPVERELAHLVERRHDARAHGVDRVGARGLARRVGVEARSDAGRHDVRPLLDRVHDLDAAIDRQHREHKDRVGAVEVCKGGDTSTRAQERASSVRDRSMSERASE